MRTGVRTTEFSQLNNARQVINSTPKGNSFVMKTWIRKSLKVGVLSAGILLFAASSAQAGTTQVADGNDGVINGNQIDVPIQIPINVCGNGIGVLLALGLGNADCVSPVTHDNDNDAKFDLEKTARTEGATQASEDNDGVLNGNQIYVPVQIPINVCGNGIAVLLALGLGNADCVSPVTHDNDNDLNVDVDKGHHGHHHGDGGGDYDDKSDRRGPAASTATSTATSTAAPTTGRTSLLGSLPKLAQSGKTLPLGNLSRGSEALPTTDGDQYTVQDAPAAAPATQPSLLSGLKNSKMNIGGLNPSELLAPMGQSAA
jgi:hypothetical protein